MIIKEVSIIIPFFNEEKRAKKTIVTIKKFFKKKKSIKVEIIFVNDGSSDNTQFILESYLKKLLLKNHSIKFYKLAFNQGKGYAIKHGVEKSQYNWILMCDFDMSTKPDQLILWTRNGFIGNINSAYFGSRTHSNSKTQKKYHRLIFGKVFAILTNLLFSINIKDTQCGFKLFHKSYALNIFKKLRSYRFVFDIDLILLLRNKKILIKELPVTWIHMPKSKLNIFIDGPAMFFNLISIKINRNRL
jgi:dolichyl-phosphate beta-glucosyltransferase